MFSSFTSFKCCSNLFSFEFVDDDWSFQSMIPMDYPEPNYSAAHLYYDKFNICCALAISCLAMDIFHLICLFSVYYNIDIILFEISIFLMVIGGICFGIPCYFIKIESPSDHFTCNQLIPYIWVLIKIIALQILAFTWIPIILYKIINVSVSEWIKCKNHKTETLNKIVLKILCINSIVISNIMDKTKNDEELESILYELSGNYFQHISFYDIERLNNKSSIFGRIYYILIHWNCNQDYKIKELYPFGLIKYILFMLYFVSKIINMFFAAFGILYLYMINKIEHNIFIMIWIIEILLLFICSTILIKMWKEQISYYLYINPAIHKIYINTKIFQDIQRYFHVIYSQSVLMDRFGNDESFFSIVIVQNTPIIT